MRTLSPKDMYEDAQSALLVMLQNWKLPKCQCNRMDKYNVVYSYNGIPPGSKKEPTIATCNNTNKSQKHKIELKTSDTKGPKLCDYRVLQN